MKNDLALYEQHRPKMGSGDIVAFQGNDVGAWLIRFGTGSLYSHVGLVIRVSAVDVDRVFIAESVLGAGVVLVPLSRKLETYRGKAWWLPLKIREFSLTEDSEAKRKINEVHKWAMQELGKPYDLKLIRSLLRYLLRRLIQPTSDAERYICSEFVVAGLKNCGLLPAGFAATLTPKEVCDLPTFTAPQAVI